MLERIAYIMRGLPGSGKSTLARMLAGSVGVIHSTDDYFMIDGEYRFDETMVKEYHRQNFEAFCRSLDDGVPIVICDNVNFRRWEWLPYQNAARARGYQVAIVELPPLHPGSLAARCIHGVSEEKLWFLYDNWNVERAAA